MAVTALPRAMTACVTNSAKTGNWVQEVHLQKTTHAAVLERQLERYPTKSSNATERRIGSHNTTGVYGFEPPHVPKLLTTKEAAALLRQPEGTLRYWRSIGYGPAYAKLGKSVVYQAEDIASFVQQHLVVPTVRTEARKEAQRVAC